LAALFEGNGDATRVSVEFERVGLKRLMLKMHSIKCKLIEVKEAKILQQMPHSFLYAQERTKEGPLADAARDKYVVKGAISSISHDFSM